MKKMMAVALSVVLLTSSTFIVLCNQADADPTNSAYQFSYDGYTLTQTGCDVDEGNSTATVSYSIVGENYSGSYSIAYTYADGKYTFVASNVTGANPEIVMVPPVVRAEGADLTINGVAASVEGGSIASIAQLYIISNGASFNIDTGAFRYATQLTKLVVSGDHITAGNRILRDCSAVREVYIDGYLSMGSKLITGLNTDERVTLSTKVDQSSTIQIIAESTFGGVTLKLLPGSSKAGSINFIGVDEVLVCEDDWANDVTVNDLSEALSNNANGLSVTRYSSGATQSSFDVAIAQGQSGVAVDKSTATENETVTITLSPEQGKQVASVSVLKDNNDAVQATVNPQNANQYTFTMPASNVTVSAIFEDVPSVSVTPSVSTLSKGDTTVITISAVNLKSVKSMNFVITYDSEKFVLKSPEYATLLENATLAGDLTQGQYVVAFSTGQNISGNLLTFQLEAKSDAALGDSLVRCTVQLNGRADGNGGNIFEAVYSAESTITIGNILGDLDSDGDVDVDDAIYLLLHTFRASEYAIPGGQSVDYDGDGDVDSDDAIWLKNYVTDPSHYPLTGGA